MNLPSAVGVPISRTIQGVSYQFPRLTLREYGGLIQAWLDKDLARLESDLSVRRATSREIADRVLSLKRSAKTDGYIYAKLADRRDGPMIVDLSLKKGGYAITADQLAMDLDDMTQLCFELWSRQFLAGYRHYLRTRFDGEPDDPKEHPPGAGAGAAGTELDPLLEGS